MDRASGGSKSVLIGSIQVTVLVGDLAQQKSDVLVCTTVSYLLLEDGRVSKALLDAGGRTLQDECSKKYPNGLLGGDIAEVGPGRLDCKTVYFINIPMSENGDCSYQEFEIRQITSGCLKKASRDNWKSITFPALGTGKTGYQQDVVASAMFKSIEDFSKRNPSSSLTGFNIIIHKKDMNTFKTFELEAKSRAVGHGNGGSGQSNSLPIGKLQLSPVTIQYGKLAEWTADILVSSCSRDMDLRKNSLARSFLQYGGPSLLSECKSKYPQGISPGVVAVVGGNQLKCKYVYFGVLRRYNSQESVQEMSSFISSCLELANKDSIKSIAFPALGTGHLGYPPKESAKTVRKCLKQFLKHNPNTSLQTIAVIIYDGDKNRESVMQAYQDEFAEKSFIEKVLSGAEYLTKLWYQEPEGPSTPAGYPKPKRRSHSSSFHHKPKASYKPIEEPASETLPEIDFSDLQFSKNDEIGRGGFGVVYHGKWMGTDVAIKTMTLRVNSVEVMKIVEQEVKVHSRLRHPHIVQIMGVCTDRTSFYIISEFIDGSDLHNLIFRHSGSKLDPRRRLVYAKQCCQAVAYLHGVKPPIIHQDIKSSNVLVSRVTRQAKLCDFGIAKIHSLSSKPTTEGTPYYMAPELLIEGKSSSFASDIWALGCTFLELFTEMDLWAPDGSLVTEYDITTRMAKNEKPPAFRRLGSQVPYSVREVIADCFDYEPLKRPTAMKLVNELDKHT
ncbi:hypothetical protein CHS0354_030477 [Potamilus streckersoni]|uniref:Protein kinase domain-containing protein n=1 Tax=Potamilus streckersoni TaxID=2493646 RepID=A0AAE0RPM1_9BIVA|nr:hypothetical protein CHS0354_030477 [Potamilus streckersoni]